VVCFFWQCRLWYSRRGHLRCPLHFSRQSLFMLFLFRKFMTKVWWSIERSQKRLNGFSMYLVMVCLVKFLNVDRGLVKEHPWIGNFGRDVVLGIHNVIVMGSWWVAFLFVKLISHILFYMYECSKGVFWSVTLGIT
jgi:hypothetical protein